MDASQQLKSYTDRCPLVAIIRGVKPDEVEAIGEAIHEAGICIVEVPLNSPDPLRSIERLADKLGDRMLVGAGTVLTPHQARDVRNAGGRIVVSPNTDVEVIAATLEAGMISAPGFYTPSEALAAIQAGATMLKLFPGEAASPAMLRAQRTIFPRAVPVIVTGGIRADNMRPWLDASATGFGLGSGLYRPGQSASETLEKARVFVAGVAR